MPLIIITKCSFLRWVRLISLNDLNLLAKNFLEFLWPPCPCVHPALPLHSNSSPSPLPFPDCFFRPPSVGSPRMLFISQGSQAVYDGLPYPQPSGKNKKTRIFYYQTDRPERTENLIISSAVHTFISLTCFRGFRKTFVFYSFSKILPGTQQRYTFTFRIRALILTGSCDRLPTAV